MHSSDIRVVLASVLPACDHRWRPGLEPAPKTPSPVDAWADRHRRTAEHLWMTLLRSNDTEQARLQFVRGFHNLDHGEIWLARVRDHLTDDALRRRADKVLEMLR